MIKIRPENINDYSAVFDVNRSAFKQEYEANLVEAIRKSENYIPSLSLVAIIDDRVIGHILFSRITIETAKTKGIEAPFEVPDEAFMVLELTSGALHGIYGTVKYPSEFGI